MRGRIGGSKGGEGMVNDNNAVGDQTVTLPSPDWDRQYRAKIKLRITKLQLIQVLKMHRIVKAHN